MRRRSDTVSGNIIMKHTWRQGRQVLASAMCAAFLLSAWPQPVPAQTSSPSSTASTQDQGYSSEQLDALLAPIALYPDQLLTQILMAATFPDDVQAAYKWVQQPANKNLTGSALEQALAPMSWDPSVKSLVPFPQVLETMSNNIDWTDQLGYAMTVQQSAVLASVQRLRLQAQENGQLQSNAQQTVTTQGQNIIIAPAQPNIVYVPAYNPTVVYGTWPYPAYPPVYYPPPPGYYAGSALVAGLAFGAGIAITAGLWGWATPGWGYGNVNVNVNRYNNINVNRQQINNSNWKANNWNGGTRTGNVQGAGNRQPPRGPVGQPRPQQGLPANSIGRPKTSVPANIARPPSGMGQQGRPNVQRPPGNPATTKPPNFSQAPARPGGGQSIAKPSAGQGGTRGNSGQVNRPSTRPSGGTRSNSPSAFNGMNDGRSAAQFGNRGAQSQRSAAGFNRGGGGGGRRR